MITEALLIGLTAWRLANLLVNESGPWGIFGRLRLFVGAGEGLIEGFLPTLFSCIMCMSIWTSVLAYFLWRLEPATVIVGGAMSIAILVDRVVRS